MVPGTVLLPIGLLLTGWAAEKQVHWIVSDIVSRLHLNPQNSVHEVHIRTGYRTRRSGYHIEFHVHPGIRGRCVHGTRCVWCIHTFFFSLLITS
jgi:hypothetical protein